MDKCPKCKSRQIIHLGKEQYRCQKCGYATPIKINVSPLRILKEETVSIPIKPLNILKEETVSIPLAELNIKSKEETIEIPLAELKIKSKKKSAKIEVKPKKKIVRSDRMFESHQE